MRPVTPFHDDTYFMLRHSLTIISPVFKNFLYML